MIGIIDFGAGNLKSVFHAFDSQGIQVEVFSDSSRIKNFTKLVLPGVGSFHDCYAQLENHGWINALNNAILIKQVPILGICLGMQLMAKKGYEGGETQGLGWFDAGVKKIDFAKKVPHVGWNDLIFRNSHPILNGVPDRTNVYFVHSYYFDITNDCEITATCEYEMAFPAIVARDNIVAVQFHPEKSQSFGLKMIDNFSKWEPL